MAGIPICHEHDCPMSECWETHHPTAHTGGTRTAEDVRQEVIGRHLAKQEKNADIYTGCEGAGRPPSMVVGQPTPDGRWYGRCHGCGAMVYIHPLTTVEFGLPNEYVVDEH